MSTHPMYEPMHGDHLASRCPELRCWSTEQLYQGIAEGTAWEDADGETEWTLPEAEALAGDLERKRGYDPVEVVPV